MIFLQSQVASDLWGAHTLGILLWLLGAFILGYVLRYIIGAKWRNRVGELEKDLQEWKARANQFEADLSTAKYEQEKTAGELKKEKSKNADLYFKLKACEESKANTDSAGSTDIDSESSGGESNIVENVAASSMSFAAANVSAGKTRSAGAGSGYAAAFANDDLKVVDGIGPKIESLLKNAGIGTWKSLASSSTNTLKGILNDAGSRYQMHDPKTWPEQAQLAAEGKWDDLIHYQKFIDDSKEGGTPAKVEKMYMKAHGLKSYAPDDLKVVEGIGPKIEQILKSSGITNWKNLAATSQDKLREVLNNAGERYRLANPRTWPKQATMAVAGQWAELKKYQDELDGGK